MWHLPFPLQFSLPPNAHLEDLHLGLTEGLGALLANKALGVVVVHGAANVQRHNASSDGARTLAAALRLVESVRKKNRRHVCETLIAAVQLPSPPPLLSQVRPLPSTHLLAGRAGAGDGLGGLVICDLDGHLGVVAVEMHSLSCRFRAILLTHLGLGDLVKAKAQLPLERGDVQSHLLEIAGVPQVDLADGQRGAM